ncbi:MAG: serine dehydratase subunit alpha family protein [Bacteroidaceae bacterium]|nr:serine dehydratase subunit alpha family protein [Bacteroidaceae bacterium]
MRRLTRLIRDDMRPALGVTEPGAIAFAVAKAREHVRGELKEIRLVLNSGMYKNACTCGIPHSREVGNEHAAALGYVAADAERGLECLESVRPRHNREARALVEAGKVKVEMGEVGSRIHIFAEVAAEGGKASVTIRDGHTNIVRIEKDGVALLEKGQKEAGNGDRQDQEAGKREEGPTIHRYTLRQLYHYAKTTPLEEIRFIGKAFTLNLALSEQAIRSRRATFTHYLYIRNGGKAISADEQQSASLLCNAAIEARVLGMPRPAMSITGSGAHGIIATLPLYASQQVNGYTEEQLLRATALSHLVCMYIKEHSGKLSAFCGCAIAAGTGMACGMALLKGGTLRTLTLAIQNMASSITGMICDGGNHGCTMKGIVAVDAAYRSVAFALQGIAIGSAHGINGSTPEETMRNMGRVASPGMVETERVIVDIMREKEKSLAK